MCAPVCEHFCPYTHVLCVCCCSAFAHERTAVGAGNSLHMCCERIFIYEGADETARELLNKSNQRKPTGKLWVCGAVLLLQGGCSAHVELICSCWSIRANKALPSLHRDHAAAAPTCSSDARSATRSTSTSLSIGLERHPLAATHV